jgi:hypothetical protein
VACGPDDPGAIGGGALRELIANSFHALDAMFFSGKREVKKKWMMLFYTRTHTITFCMICHIT